MSSTQQMAALACTDASVVLVKRCPLEAYVDKLCLQYPLPVVLPPPHNYLQPPVPEIG